MEGHSSLEFFFCTGTDPTMAFDLPHSFNGLIEVISLIALPALQLKIYRFKNKHEPGPQTYKSFFKTWLLSEYEKSSMISSRCCRFQGSLERFRSLSLLSFGQLCVFSWAEFWGIVGWCDVLRTTRKAAKDLHERVKVFHLDLVCVQWVIKLKLVRCDWQHWM